MQSCAVKPEENEAINALCRKSFEAFADRAFRVVQPATPYEYNWHIGCIAEHIQAMIDGEISRLIINLPPRMLKSYLISVALPAWILGNNPSDKFIVTSYSFPLAKEMASKCRYILEDDWYKACFPQTRIDQKQNEKHHWNTTERGQYYAASALGSITGVGANWVLSDDPLKPAEALSETIRARTNENIRNTLFSRFDDQRIAKFLMVMQRLHDDDPTGNLCKEGGYTVLKLPAEAKSDIKIILGNKTWEMKTGDLLFPDRLSQDTLNTLRQSMTDYHYVGQYMQEPVPIGGGEFKDTWVKYYDSISPKKMNIYILCDAAAGEEVNKRKKKTSDWTAFMVVGTAPDNNYYLLDIVRDRLNPTERINELFRLHRKWNGLAGKPAKVGYEKYGLMSDTHYIREKQEKENYRFNLIELGGIVPKETRIRRLIPDLQCGRWWLPRVVLRTDTEGREFDLVQELVRSEMPVFPKARFDDMIDAWSRIYDKEMECVFPAPERTADDTWETYQPDDGADWRDF